MSHGLAHERVDRVAGLVTQLKDGNIHAHRNAAWMLGRTGPEAREAIPVLISAFQDPDQGMRRSAIQALGTCVLFPDPLPLGQHGGLWPPGAHTQRRRCVWYAICSITGERRRAPGWEEHAVGATGEV